MLLSNQERASFLFNDKSCINKQGFLQAAGPQPRFREPDGGQEAEPHGVATEGHRERSPQDNPSTWPGKGCPGGQTLLDSLAHNTGGEELSGRNTCAPGDSELEKVLFQR